MKDESFYWDISNSPYKSDFLEESMIFGINEPIFLIDQFNGKRPIIINQEFIDKGNISFNMFPSALLDSNVINKIDGLIQHGKKTDGLIEFLKFLSSRQWDSSAMFYYLEHFSKSSVETFRKNAIRRTESLLTLHSMNDEIYVKTGTITPNNEAIAHYLLSSNSSSLREVAEKRVDDFIISYNKESLTQMIETIEIALIKMVLIRKYEMKNSSPIEQYNEFIRFLEYDLEIMLAREAHLSLHYFFDKAGRLLVIQSNTPIEKATSIIKSTAWDIFLLRMPEIMFHNNPEEICIAYVSTQEKKLQSLAKLFTIENIAFQNGGMLPGVSYNMVEIPKNVKLNIELTTKKTKNINNKKNIPIGLHQAMFKQLHHLCN